MGENEHIIHQGDEGNIFYIIKSGSVVCRDVEMKSEDLVLHAGDYFGELALLTSKTRQRAVVQKMQVINLLSVAKSTDG